MKRSFVVPAAIALALHAMLFIGSSKPPELDKNKPKPPRSKIEEQVKQIEVELRNLSEPDPDPETTANNKGGGGSKDAGPLALPDIPPVNRPGLFEFTQETVPVRLGKDSNKLPDGFRRLGDGPGDGNGPGIVGSLYLDNPPATRSQREPVYPHGMKSAGVTGTVWVEFVVDVAGRVHDVRVVKSTHEGFEAATVAAVSAWRFEPGKRNGIPVLFRMTIPIVFSLSD